MKISLSPVLLPLAALAVFSSCSTEADADAGKGPSNKPTSGKAGAPKEDVLKTSASKGIYALEVQDLAGKKVDLADYAGKVSLVVNVASRCGFTRQYAGLQKLHEEMKGKGFQVLGFPCNDFGGQEPGTAEEIQQFCSSKYGVAFPMFAKVKIKGEDRSPIYDKLITATGKTPGWNFCKYLVGKDGKVIGFWKSGTRPDSAELRAAIEKAL